MLGNLTLRTWPSVFKGVEDSLSPLNFKDKKFFVEAARAKK